MCVKCEPNTFDNEVHRSYLAPNPAFIIRFVGIGQLPDTVYHRLKSYFTYNRVSYTLISDLVEACAGYGCDDAGRTLQHRRAKFSA